MKRLGVGAAAVLMLAAGTAVAFIPPLDIDFRESIWSGANGQDQFTLGGITLTALYDGWCADAKLTQSPVDGIGVERGWYDANPDEIDESGEALQVSFAGGAGDNLLGVWVANLFVEAGRLLWWRWDYAEQGEVQLTLLGEPDLDIGFQAVSDTDGDVLVPFGGSLDVAGALFVSMDACFENHDFSVVGFVRATGEQQLPEAASAWVLLGLLLVGLEGMRRRG